MHVSVQVCVVVVLLLLVLFSNLLSVVFNSSHTHTQRGLTLFVCVGRRNDVDKNLI